MLQFSAIIENIKETAPKKLPGFDAQKKMGVPIRKLLPFNKIKLLNPKTSAVLILIYKRDNQAHIALIKRPEYDGAHSGQISLPGGKYEEEDGNTMNTALRETREEIGVPENDVEVLLALTHLYVPPSNFIIYPYIGLLNYPPTFIPDPTEVASILEVPINHLLDEKNKTTYHYISRGIGIEFKSPAIQFEAHQIWGATAMILSEFLEIIK